MPLRSAWTILLGVCTTLCVYGYRFGHSNHTVYLLDALRLNDPTILQNDWFTTSTLQYHFLFSRFAALLLRLDLIEPVFLLGYLLLVVAFHWALRGVVLRLGGNDATYLLAVGLYYLFAAGTALGMYQFFQDSALLPSNIANVALLWGIWKWLEGKRIGAGISFGVAGLFHLNHALVGSALWIGMCLWSERKHLWNRSFLVASACALLPSLVNIGLALSAKMTRSSAMPLNEFIQLYVRLRHPHHYDPSSWPVGIWIAFLLPTVAALWILGGYSIPGVSRDAQRSALDEKRAPLCVAANREAHRFVVLVLIPIVVALMGAGIVYVSETLVQMSLYRFSIYPQLLGCAAAAIVLQYAVQPLKARVAGIAITTVLSITCILLGPFFGLFSMPGDDPRYLALCAQIRQETPADALFLVPPDEESMRLVGQRAIVVNFKHVPQLSAELENWNQRLCDVLAMENLQSLPHGFKLTLQAIARRYDSLALEQRIAVAKKYGARFIVYRDATGTPMLYDVGG